VLRPAERTIPVQNVHIVVTQVLELRPSAASSPMRLTV
jgi:hypothetical protein